jgi:hypothetical protein
MASKVKTACFCSARLENATRHRLRFNRIKLTGASLALDAAAAGLHHSRAPFTCSVLERGLLEESNFAREEGD